MYFPIFEELEKKHEVVLIKKGKIEYTDELPKPFLKGYKVKAELFSEGRYAGESFAVAASRIITVNCPFNGRRMRKIDITRDKHNIFYGNYSK